MKHLRNENQNGKINRLIFIVIFSIKSTKKLSKTVKYENIEGF
jgi:hypothetical protein